MAHVIPLCSECSQNGLLLLYAGGMMMSKDFLTRDCVFEGNRGTAFLAMPASTIYGIVMQNANSVLLLLSSNSHETSCA